MVLQIGEQQPYTVGVEYGQQERCVAGHKNGGHYL